MMARHALARRAAVTELAAAVTELAAAGAASRRRLLLANGDLLALAEQIGRGELRGREAETAAALCAISARITNAEGPQPITQIAQTPAAA